MANIRKTQTRGDQTLLSNFRVDSDVQTYLKKDAETNTIKNSGTQYKAEKERHDVGVWFEIKSIYWLRWFNEESKVNDWSGEIAMRTENIFYQEKVDKDSQSKSVSS